MEMSILENTEIQTLKCATTILKRVKRDYRTALARIRRTERFLAELVEGLNCEAGKWILFGPEPFAYPPRLAIYNDGNSQIVEKYFTVFFTKDDTGWHFSIIRTLEHEGDTGGQDIKATRLVDASAGLVLCCAENIESDAVQIVECLAALMEASYYQRSPATTPRASTQPSKGGKGGKRGKGITTARAMTKGQNN